MSAITKGRSASRLRRHREERPGRAPEHPSVPESIPSVPAAGPTASVPRRRTAGASQDAALYTCQCGFVFEAPVSTSVGCPHCGDTQAW